VIEVVDRPLSLRRQADVPAPPFFDLPLSREAKPLAFDIGKLSAKHGVEYRSQ
jgi:hypothetical protein